MSGRAPVHAEWVVSCDPTPFALLPEELIYDTEVQHGAVRLWAALMRHANRKGEAWPSLRTLADLLGVNRTTVLRWREHLEERGWLFASPQLSDAGNPTGRVVVSLFWTRVDWASGQPVHERTGGSHQRNRGSHESNEGVAPAQRDLIETQERDSTIESTPSARGARAGEVEEVFAYWLDVASREGVVRDLSRFRLTAGRRKVIAARLKDGYTVDELRAVVDAVFRSEHHRSKAAYCDPASFLRSSDKVDRHLANANGHAPAGEDRRAIAEQSIAKARALVGWMESG